MLMEDADLPLKRRVALLGSTLKAQPGAGGRGQPGRNGLECQNAGSASALTVSRPEPEESNAQTSVQQRARRGLIDFPFSLIQVWERVTPCNIGSPDKLYLL